MAEIHEFPDRKRIEREASDWLARLNADDAGEQDLRRFAAWRDAHPQHARIHAEMQATWDRLAAAGRTVRSVSFGSAMDPLAGTRGRGRRRWAAAAASLAFVAVGMAMLWMLPRDPMVFETGVGQQAAIALPDGSQVALNSSSRMRIEYDDADRVVRLERGEAYFDVAHESGRPFWVVADRSWVRAVGTAFSVYLRDQGARVTVREGRVRVAASAVRGRPSDLAMERLPNSLLGAGDQADVQPDVVQLRALPAQGLDRQLSWTAGNLHFEDARLQDIMAEMSRYSPLRVQLDPRLESMRVSGSFRTSPQGMEAFLDMLEGGLELQVERGPGERVRVQ